MHNTIGFVNHFQLYKAFVPAEFSQGLAPDPYLLFNIKRMKIVVVGQFGTSRHVFKRIQSDPVNTIDGPAGKIQPNIPKN